MASGGTDRIAAALKLIEGGFVSETPSRIARRVTPVDHDDAACGGRRSARLHSPRLTGAPARHCAVARRGNSRAQRRLISAWEPAGIAFTKRGAPYIKSKTDDAEP